MKYGAYGLVEVVGDAHGILILDRMCKAAEVALVARYTRNGGHDTVIVGGEISAVQAAVEAAVTAPPCDIVASAVISGPAEETVKIFETWQSGKM